MKNKLIKKIEDAFLEVQLCMYEGLDTGKKKVILTSCSDDDFRKNILKAWAINKNYLSDMDGIIFEGKNGFDIKDNILMYLVGLVNLKKIDLSRTKVSEEGKDYIRCLVAKRNYFGTEKIKKYIDDFEEKNPELKKLRIAADLEKAGISKIEIDKKLADFIINKLPLNVRVKINNLYEKLFYGVSKIALKEKQSVKIGVSMDRSLNLEFQREKRSFPIFGRKIRSISIQLDGYPKEILTL